MKKMIPAKIGTDSNSILSLSRYNIKLMQVDHSTEVCVYHSLRSMLAVKVFYQQVFTEKKKYLAYFANHLN